MSLFAFDDKKVQNYIDWSMRENSMFRPMSSQLSQAYSSLITKRGKDDPNDNDDELAAAEHYMYARYMVCSGKHSGAYMDLLTLGYDPVKVLGYVPLFFLIRKAAGHSWSWPSVSSMRWGFKGVTDGRANRLIDKDPDAKEK